MSIFGLVLLTLLWLLFIYLCYHVRYVTFNTDLSICGQNRRFIFPPCILIISFMFLFGFLLTEYFFDLTLWSFSYINFEYVNPVKLSRRSRKAVVQISLWTSLIYIFFTATTYVACIFCLLVFQIFCHFSMRTTQSWLPIILIILSNDIHLNPGPEYNNNFFNFMSWNLNSLAKDNFQRVSLIEAHNSIFDYDLISICETSLNDTVELPEILLNNYTFLSSHNPSNTRHGGVGLFYKNSLPVIPRHDLSFNESIVIELKFGRKKIFFTVIYRSPSSDRSSHEFQTFLLDFQNLYLKIKAENPFEHFLQVILMPTQNFGGPRVIQHLKAVK